MQFDVLTLFPEFFDGPLHVSMMKRGIERGIVSVRCVQVRDFTQDKHHKVDDRPFGGGAGMVMKPEPLTRAIASCRQEHSHVIYLSPQGSPWTASRAKEYAKKEHIILLCGHYEGIDQRVIDSQVDEEISIGDYILIHGCTPALILMETICRFLPNFLGDEESANQESFQRSREFDYPQYTRPAIFQGNSVPDVLLQGNHREIALWREEKAREKALRVRPEWFEESESPQIKSGSI